MALFGNETVRDIQGGLIDSGSAVEASATSIADAQRDVGDIALQQAFAAAEELRQAQSLLLGVESQLRREEGVMRSVSVAAGRAATGIVAQVGSGGSPWSDLVLRFGAEKTNASGVASVLKQIRSDQGEKLGIDGVLKLITTGLAQLDDVINKGKGTAEALEESAGNLGGAGKDLTQEPRTLA